MDIFTHALSGAAAASAIAALSRQSLWKKALIVGCGAMGAVLPDLDAVTRWSGFDGSVGRLLHLRETGHKIYFSNYWYSHHNFCHSLAAGLLFTAILGMMIFILGRLLSPKQAQGTFRHSAGGCLVALFSGFCLHLAGDLPTPASTWQGIKLFWPLATPVGGYAYTWWWNNYDIFLLLAAACLLNGLLILTQAWFQNRNLRYLPMLVFILAAGTAVFQITHRPVKFGGPGIKASHAENDRRSLDVQKKILGPDLYATMTAMDHRLKIPF